MSSENSENKKNNSLVQRFIEVCGSDEPAHVQRLLKISYQAAKNYLNGRLPQTETLVKIAENTPYSIHWFLTGTGNKFARESVREPAKVLDPATRQAMVEVCIEVYADIRKKEQQAYEAKVVKLDAAKLKIEQTLETENVVEIPAEDTIILVNKNPEDL